MWYEIETWISGRPWQKEIIDDTDSLDQVHDFTNQLNLARGVPSVSLNFLSWQGVKNMETRDFHEELSQ